MNEPLRLLPPSSIAMLSDIITGGVSQSAPLYGIYRTAAELRRFFALCDLDFDQQGRTRTDTVMALLCELNDEPVKQGALIRIVEALADPLLYRDIFPDTHPEVMAALNKLMHRAGREVLVSPDGAPRVVLRGTAAPVTSALQERTEALSLDTAQRDLRRALEQAESDPEGALTSACSLLESVCRTILIRLGKPLPKERNLRPLADAARAALGLSTARADLPKLVAEDVNQVLTGLTTTINGVAALRTHAGDAHGREAGHPRVDPRIARLGTNAAGTLALFLVETWQKRGA